MTLYVALDKRRQGLLIQGQPGEKDLVFFLPPKMDKSQLSELIHKQLESQGVPKERHGSLVAQAEAEYELRIKVHEAEQELRRLMQLKVEGAHLMQRGWRRWQPTSFRPLR